MGSIKNPYLFIPILSPNAFEKASPRTMPISSTVWCSSMCVSPLAMMDRSNDSCLENKSSIWLRKPIGVSIFLLPTPSILNEMAIFVSLVFLSIIDSRFIKRESLDFPQYIPKCVIFAILLRDLAGQSLTSGEGEFGAEGFYFGRYFCQFFVLINFKPNFPHKFRAFFFFFGKLIIFDFFNNHVYPCSYFNHFFFFHSSCCDRRGSKTDTRRVEGRHIII